MEHPRNSKLVANARMLRRNMTKEERHLWYDCLRYCRPRFRRQEIIGNYIADFYCQKAKLVIELDGSQHFESDAIQKDNVRTEYFHSLGMKVLRFANTDINRNLDGVFQAVMIAMEECGVTAEITGSP